MDNRFETKGSVALATSNDNANSLVGSTVNGDFDELDHQVQRHRNELQAIDAQVAKLEEAIDADQKRIKALKQERDAKTVARTRLLAVRGAMAKFIQGLQASER